MSWHSSSPSRSRITSPPTQVPGLVEKYRARIEQMGYTVDWLESYSLAIRVTPERAWTI
jgi:hypothetical protein